jgi:hypothetical protein
MKSWGIRILTLYLGFVALIGCMVGLTMSQKVELVSQDYYQQEILYQKKMNRLSAAKSLRNPLTWKIEKGKIEIKFPQQFDNKPVQGIITIYRPSDSRLDQTIKFRQETCNGMNIPIKPLINGLYKLDIQWEMEKREYESEAIITIR